MDLTEFRSSSVLAIGAGLSSAGGLVWGVLSYDAIPVALGIAGGIALGITSLWQRVKDERLAAVERRLTREIAAHDATLERLREYREGRESGAEQPLDH